MICKLNHLCSILRKERIRNKNQNLKEYYIFIYEHRQRTLHGSNSNKNIANNYKRKI